METDPATLARLVDLLSRERLKALIDLTGSDAEAVALHQMTLGLGGEMMKVIATIEIALRNSVVQILGRHFAVANWLPQPPINFRWRDMERTNITKAVDSARRAKYSKMTQAEKTALEVHAYPNGRPAHVSHLQRAKERRKHIAVSEGKVVAELTLHFWKRLFGPEYEQSLWRPALKRAFPNKKLTRAIVATHLEVIYQARNRLAHHEPVLHKRFRETMASVAFIIAELDTANPAPLVALLHEDIAQVTASEAALSVRLDSFRQ